MTAARSCISSLRGCALQTHRCQATARSVRSLSTGRRIDHPAPLFLDFLAPSWNTSAHRPLRHGELSSDSRLARSRAPQPQHNRCFSATPQREAKAVQNPRKDDDGNDMDIIITPRAAHRLAAIAEKDKNPDLALRVSVESGGCHGFQYLMRLISKSEIDAEDDTVFEDTDLTTGKDGFTPKVVMDEPSLELLKGSSIDYTMELIGSQFKVTGIPGATSSCGCGTSFDIAV